MTQVHLVVHGRVQGVGFRWFAQTRARALGLCGHVANRPDGSVEVLAEGERHRLDEFVALLRRGPRSAAVASVDETWSEGPARHADFVIAA